MREPTPSEIRKREKTIINFDKNWQIDLNTKEIQHNPSSNWFSSLIHFFWKKKYKVEDLYWWSSQKWATSEMMSFQIPIKHDDIILKGFPRKNQMLNGWTIPNEDLKYLYDGPLSDESGNKLLVNYQTKINKFIAILSQLRPISWIITFIIFGYKYKETILKIWNK